MSKSHIIGNLVRGSYTTYVLKWLVVKGDSSYSIGGTHNDTCLVMSSADLFFRNNCSQIYFSGIQYNVRMSNNLDPDHVIKPDVFPSNFNHLI